MHGVVSLFGFILKNRINKEGEVDEAKSRREFTAGQTEGMLTIKRA